MKPATAHSKQITDSPLARGWEPISFVQRDGFRTYRHKAMR